MTAAAFWRFSLEVYGDPEIEAICLALQERHGVDVNLLLFAGWLGRRGIRLSADRLRILEAGVRRWRTGSLLPLRAVRRDLKEWLERPESARSVARDEIARLRTQVKEAELEAEKVEQRRLVALATGWPEDAPPGPALIAANLAVVHDFSDARDALAALVRAAAR